MNVTAAFVGGPLDGRTLPLDEWEGCYWHRQGHEAHVYWRRYGYVPGTKKRPTQHSPHVYEHQPQLTKELSA